MAKKVEMDDKSTFGKKSTSRNVFYRNLEIIFALFVSVSFLAYSSNLLSKFPSSGDLDAFFIFSGIGFFLYGAFDLVNSVVLRIRGAMIIVLYKNSDNSERRLSLGIGSRIKSEKELDALFESFKRDTSSEL